MRLHVPAMLLLASLAFPAAAQETRVAEAGHVAPAATVEDLAWLSGGWSGPGIGGALSHESWLPPAGDTMVGLFVQEDGDGGLMFTEHMYIVEEENGSLAVLLKHFNADLTGWEERDDMVRFPLVALEDCAAYFNGLTYRCDGDDGLVVAVRMSNSDGTTGELVFNFRRAETAMRPTLCPDAMTTVDLDQCHVEVLARAEEQRATYLAAALEQYADEPDVADRIRASDEAFTAYRDAECGAVLQKWIDGTIRGIMTLSCRIDMTDARTHLLWENWLTYQDSSPPVLPEPGPSR
ncbi:DUF6265 family protein [Aurantiacibacter gilvus]|uniref:DUF6265 family protein n=1 Tax=Aurantiacibacter gilvus TaxID=3139141 RepID=A0ABU9IH27_9SPHN